jgi:hypothetical protein
LVRMFVPNSNIINTNKPISCSRSSPYISRHPIEPEKES